MGSDSSPQHLFQAVLATASAIDASFTIFAPKKTISSLKRLVKTPKASVCFYPASEVITMEDNPLHAIRHKLDSSMHIGLKLLKEGQVNALISAGNTGALVAGAKLILRMWPGIRKPALLARLPTRKGLVNVIDVGGVIHTTLQSLIQSACLGIAYDRAIDQRPTKVGLLNIGSESKKGSALLQEAYTILQSQNSSKFQFLGNVEARDLFEGHVHVLVTDGFTGNILLKTIEGAANFIVGSCLDVIDDSSTKNALAERFNCAEYPGALVCGVDHLLIKCHGNVAAPAIRSTIKTVYEAFQNRLIPKMHAELEDLLIE